MGGENNSILELSFQMGETLLRNGAEISRVQETMERVAQSYHAESFNVYVLTNGGPQNATTSVVYLLYKSGFINQQVGYSSAIAVVFFIIVFVISEIQNYIIGKE